MNSKSTSSGILNILNGARSRLPENLNHVLNKRDKALGWVLLDIANFHKATGIHAFFSQKKENDLKQNFYVVSKLILSAIGHKGGSDFEVGNEFFYALLSDSPQVINEMASVETPELLNDRHNPLKSRFKVHMWQLVILGDYDALRLKVEKLAKNGRKEDRELASAGNDFFTLLMKSDKQGLEELIQKHARIRSSDPLTEGFLSFLGTLEAKLCWLKGIPVQIDSPLVPMALMPVSPLSHYDDVYEFLQPGWTPPPQGVMAKISRWIRK